MIILMSDSFNLGLDQKKHIGPSLKQTYPGPQDPNRF